MSNIRNVASTDPAPLIAINVSSLHGSITIKVLPDSGADISAAGTEILHHLNEHVDNLLPSRIIPRAVNGAKMYPIGKLPVKFMLGDKEYSDAFHIYPNIQGALISWKACKQLSILPECYPHPITHLNKLTITTPSPEPITTNIPMKSPLLSLEYAKDQYPTIFDGQIRCMEGEMFHISLTDDARPFCVNTPRSIPFAYREKLKAELDLLQAQHIIAPVVEVTEWCAPIVVTPKKGTDRIRMCVDLSRLNRYVRRERYQSLTPAEAVADIAASSAKVFTVLDAMKGYHHCPLDEDSQLLTTFITPHGRFKYLRAPYGISSISEHYDRRMAEAFTGLIGFRRIVDDIVIYDSDPQQHTAHVMQFLQRCADKHIALNLDKCKFCQTEVTFAGFRLSAQGYQVDHSITDAISKFPKPSNRMDLRSFFGLVNQLSSSTSEIASLLTPLRPLLSTKNDFTWAADHDHAFTTMKQSLTVAPILSFFDATRPSRLCTDASRHGLGFILQQRTPEGIWTLIQAGSRFLTDTESRYAVIELEMLAVCWAVCKCKLFLAGLQHFTVVTDHNPLIPIMNSRQSFCRTAIPDVLWSDGGPQFTCKKFKDFSQQWGFLHKISTPHYPQCNGKIEATVKSMKKIIRSSWNGRFLDDDKFCRALLQYRNTPSRKDGTSPAQKLYGHPIQDILPAHRRSFSQEWQQKSQEVEEQANQTLKSSEAFYNTHTHPLPDIDIGSHVAIQNPRSKLWDIYGIVINIGPYRRYYVKTGSGRILVRNRRFLRRRIPLSIPTSCQQSIPTSCQPSNSTPRPTQLNDIPAASNGQPTDSLKIPTGSD